VILVLDQEGAGAGRILTRDGQHEGLGVAGPE
jgi:hypothetical protein